MVVEVLACPAVDQNPDCHQFESLSSGVLVSADGEVLTGYGTVTPVARLMVVTLDGQRHPAVLVGFDEVLGLALLRTAGVGAVHVSPAAKPPAAGAEIFTLGFSDLGELTPRIGMVRAALPVIRRSPAASSGWAWPSTRPGERAAARFLTIGAC